MIGFCMDIQYFRLMSAILMNHLYILHIKQIIQNLAMLQNKLMHLNEYKNQFQQVIDGYEIDK